MTPAVLTAVDIAVDVDVEPIVGTDVDEDVFSKNLRVTLTGVNFLTEEGAPRD